MVPHGISVLGMINAPAAFQKCMEETPEGLRDECYSPYTDDVLCYFRASAEHLEILRQIFYRLHIYCD